MPLKDFWQTDITWSLWGIDSALNGAGIVLVAFAAGVIVGLALGAVTHG